MPQPDLTGTFLPIAPYPPMHVASPARSSITSSPHYRTRNEGTSLGRVSPVSTSTALGEHEMQGPNVQRSQFAEMSLVTNRPQPTTISRAKFYHNGTLACINAAANFACAPDEESNRSRKLGPVLLELRSLELSNNDDCLFETKTIASSRGNPQLGTSVSSTCLDLPVVQQYTSRMAAATGLTTGMLAVHSFSESLSEDMLTYSSTVEYYHVSRHHRQSSAVSWRPGQSNYVAIGLLGTGNPGPQQGPRRGGSTLRGGGDREFCCFVWDVEASAGKKNAVPISKLSHNTPVASLAWVMDGQTLAVGTHSRNVQLYDMRVSGTNAPPLSAYAHNFGVHGIEVHPQNPVSTRLC
jgi:WD40 repeat protein